jgi:hypothetical protein
MEIWKKKTEGGDSATAAPVRVVKPIETFDWLKTRSERLFKELEGQLAPKAGEAAHTRLDKDREELFKAFDGFKKNKEVIRVTFDTCDTTGTFTAMTKEGVLFVLPGFIDMDEEGYEKNKYKAAHMLGMELDLLVDKVDRANGQIIMQKPSRGPQNPKTVVARELSKACEKAEAEGGELPTVIGRINKVYPDYALVDILNIGLMGTIGRRYWKKAFTRALDTIVREGDFYRFKVSSVKRAEDSGRYKISLSRIAFEEDPWDDLNFTDVEPGGAVIVECVSKPYDKNYWWGKCDRLPGVELTCEYTQRFTREKDVRNGIRYLCVVKKINPGVDGKKRYISAVPFRVYREDVTKLASMLEVADNKLSVMSEGQAEESVEKKKGSGRKKKEAKKEGNE